MGNIVDKWFVRIGKLRIAIKRKYELCKGRNLDKVKHDFSYKDYVDCKYKVLSLGYLEFAYDYS